VKRRIFKLTVIAAVCVVLCLCLLAVKAVISGGYTSQQMAQRWQAGSVNYAQLTWFLPESGGYRHSDVELWRRSIDKAFEEEAIAPQADTARLWIDCYSGEREVQIANGDNSVTARAIVTGGDFFAFHPVTLLDGWYYSEDDIMDDRVILDKNLAWELFGGYDLEGISLNVNGQYCLIAGVCDLPENKAELECYTNKPTVYLPSSLMQRIGGEATVTCYEVVAPNPVKGFAVDKIGNALAFADGSYESVTNTKRFNFTNSLKTVSEFGKRSQRISDIFFPWWENAARYIESWCALLVFAACVFLIYPVFYIFGMAGYAIVKRKFLFEKTANIFKKVFKGTKSSANEEENQ